MKSPFKTKFAQNIFFTKYALDKSDTWAALAERLVDDVCGTFQGKAEPLLSKDDRGQLQQYITDMKFIPGGRYLRYAGRPFHAFNNCFMLRAEFDTREEWGAVMQRASGCLMTGGGIGVDYSRLRASGEPLKRAGGNSSGPMNLMYSVNELGRNVMQGGYRRAAMYGSLNWQHGDAEIFLKSKNWADMPIGKIKKRSGEPYTIADAKQDDFNFHAPLDMTNISLNYDDAFLACKSLPSTFLHNVRQALQSGEPGFSFNFGAKSNETLRNACSELTSEDDSDVCNLGSINLANIADLKELEAVTSLASQFLVCGTLRADLPYQKVYEVREKNRRLGLGLMGVHEWLISRGLKYEINDELREWLSIWRYYSVIPAQHLCDTLGISKPVGYRAIAPTGTISILASTTSGIEPLFAVAMKRLYLAEGKWRYEYVVDAMASHLIKTLHVTPESIESASDLAADPERRIKFQADVQDYVDHAISSTINLPEWGSDDNNEDKVESFAKTLAQYAPRLRGFTCYPNGARGGQPLKQVEYAEAIKHEGVVFEVNDVCDITNRGGTCGS